MGWFESDGTKRRTRCLSQRPTSPSTGPRRSEAPCARSRLTIRNARPQAVDKKSARWDESFEADQVKARTRGLSLATRRSRRPLRLFRVVWEGPPSLSYQVWPKWASVTEMKVFEFMNKFVTGSEVSLWSAPSRTGLIKGFCSSGSETLAVVQWSGRYPSQSAHPLSHLDAVEVGYGDGVFVSDEAHAYVLGDGDDEDPQWVPVNSNRGRGGTSSS